VSTLTDPVTGEVFQYVTRGEWGARAARYVNALVSLANGIFGHHTVTPTQPSASLWRGIQNFHMDSRGWSDIAYSFGYDQDGVIYEGRGWDRSGGHTAGYNSTSYAFCFIGNSDNDRPSDKAFRAFTCLHRLTAERQGPAGVRGHRDVNPTSCPGSIVYAWIAAGMPVTGAPGPAPAPTPDPAPAPAPAPAPPPPPTDLLNQVIRKGSSAEAIVTMQGQLAWWGLYPKDQLDGLWGPNTEGAVRQLQTNLNNDGFDAGAVDGVWGPQTYGAYKAWVKSLASAPPDPAPAPAPSGGFSHWSGQVMAANKPYPTGNHVAEVQFCLNVVWGADRARWVAVDGVYGPATAQSVRSFQQVYNVFFDPNIDEDGVFGPATAGALETVLRRKGVW